MNNEGARADCVEDGDEKQAVYARLQMLEQDAQSSRGLAISIAGRLAGMDCLFLTAESTLHQAVSLTYILVLHSAQIQ